MSLLIEQLSQLYDHASEPVCAVSDKKMIYANPAARNVFGNILENELLLYVNDIISVGSGSLLNTSKAFKHRKYDISFTPVDDQYIICFSTKDPTAAQNTQNMMKAVYETVGRAFAYMNTASDEMTDGMLDEELRKLDPYFASFEHNYYKAFRVVENCAVLSESMERVTPSKAHGYSVFDIVTLVNAIIRAVNDFLGDDIPEIRFSAPEKGIFVFANSGRIQLMLFNMLSNSIKYTEPDGVIEIKAEKINGKLALSVSDNGIGIPDEKLSSVWNRYAMPRNKLDNKAGAGFGLAVVRIISHQHGGTAFIDSTPGKGTRVTAILDVIVSTEKARTLLREEAVNEDTKGWPSTAERDRFYSAFADIASDLNYGYLYML